MAATDSKEQERPAEPRGFGEHSRGLAGEYAHEQGWGLDVEERARQPKTPQNTDGGTDYEYGARDFGDSPVNTDLQQAESSSATADVNAAAGKDEASKPKERTA